MSSISRAIPKASAAEAAARTNDAKFVTAASLAGLPATAYLEYRHQMPDGTAGGGATAGSWFTRTLTVESADSAGIGSLASNVVTLPAGTYECEISVPGFKVNLHQARLYNVTGAAVLLYGTTEKSGGGQDVVTHSTVTGRFTLGSATDVRVEHRVSTDRATDGLGAAATFGNVEVYTVARFWKVA